MKKIDGASLSSFSELFINLSAAWFFSGFLAPFSENLSAINKISILTGNLTLGIVCLEIGIRLRRLKKKYDN